MNSPVDDPEELSATVAGNGALPRTLIGTRYEVISLLGAGGMGNVYKARDTELDELVAIKVLLPQVLASPGALAGFRREVKLARKVTHPNVARVFDLGEHGAERVLSMELIEGESLGARLRREGALPLAGALAIARAVCAGVGAAHAVGVVHRDLKPDNVMLARDGRVVVTDFGIARAVTDGARTAGVFGTPAYMAPEQIDERAPIDHRADLYAVGELLFEMVTGTPPWTGQSAWAVAAARLVDSPPDLRGVRPGAPAALAALVLHCMARDPAKRPDSMAELQRALEDPALEHSDSAGAGPRRGPPPGQAPITNRTDTRVAVLPFTNLGGADQQYVADGITEDLIDALSVARGVRVRSRGAVLDYAGGAMDARNVGRELDVQIVVEGSVRRSTTGYRVNARVLSVADGFQLWARRFDVKEGELLAEVDAIAQSVAHALSTQLEAPAREPVDGQAVDLYLRARHAYHRSFSGDRGAAGALFAQLLASTPDDPRALAGYASAACHQLTWTTEERQRAMHSARRAVELAPSMPEAAAALGSLLLQEGRVGEAVLELRRALRLAPAHVEALEALGRVLGFGPHPDAAALLEAAVAREPRFEFPYIGAATLAELCGDRPGSDSVLARARLHAPAAVWGVEARFAVWRRDVGLAERLLAVADVGNPQQAPGRSWLLVVLGLERPAPAPPLPPGQLMPWYFRVFFLESAVELACCAGDVDGALVGLRWLDGEGGLWVNWLEHCPVLAPLRALPAAQAILSRFRERFAAVVAAYEGPLPAASRGA